MPQNLNQLSAYFTKAVEQFQTTLSLAAAYQAPVVYVTTFNGANSSYSNGDLVAFAIDAGNSKQNVVVGTVNLSNNSLTNCVWTEGGNNNHASGAAVADFSSATDWDALVAGILKEHKNNGKHGNVNADSLSVSGVTNLAAKSLNGSTLQDNSVSASSLNGASFGLNIKQGQSTVGINPANGDNSFPSTEISFTLASPCVAIVTVDVSTSSTSDFEFHPTIYVDNLPYNKLTGAAAAGNTSNRATNRSYTAKVILTAGTHLLRAGAFYSSGTSLNVAAGGASITALVLGNVTA